MCNHSLQQPWGRDTFIPSRTLPSVPFGVSGLVRALPGSPQKSGRGAQSLTPVFPQSGSPVATFKQHVAPVTSVEWHPQDSGVFAASGADNQITQWDLAVERDLEAGDMEAEPGLAGLPQQLLFVHQGETDLKELHWHPQCAGVLVSTALSGFTVFRTISV